MSAWTTTEISPTTKLTLLALEFLCGRKSYCDVSIADVGAITGLSKRSIQRSIRALEKRGLVVAIPECGDVNRYKLEPQA